MKRIVKSATGNFFFSLLFTVFSVFLRNDNLYAGTSLTEKGISLPGEPCRVAPYRNWTKQEQWVWKRICERESADFNTAEEYGGNLRPDEPEDWPLSRQLRGEFLETILSHEPYRSAIPRQGVRIEGAWFNESVDLKGVKIEHMLALGNSRFDKYVDLTQFQSISSLVFTGLVFKETLDMLDAKIGTLIIADSSFEGPLIMQLLRTENLVTIVSSQFKDVNLSMASIGGAFMIDNSLFEKEVNLTVASIGGLFGITNSSFEDKLSMGLMQIKGHAFLGNRTTETSETTKTKSSNIFKEIDMSGAGVGGGLYFQKTIFNGPVILNSLQVGETLGLEEITAQAHQIDLSYADISGNAEITNGTFAKLDLTGTTIRRELRFESGPKWEENSSMVLRNASVDAIQDNKNGWPDKLELDGFTYKQLGDGSSDSMADREETWLIDWLERQKSYSPQPYTQLSNVLTQLGRDDMARAVLYSGKERSRAQALTQARWGDWLWLSLQNIFIGYGQKIYYALLWALLFIGIGALIFQGSKESKEYNMPYGIAYSFDMLLPIITLRQKHYEIDLLGWRRYYFFFHKIMGYVLASFLIAGLSGMVE